MANYTICLTRKFTRNFEKLSKIDQQMVLNKLALLQKTPFYTSLRSKKMEGSSELYESRVNIDIRILWRFEGNEIIVMVDVGHHDVLEKY